MPEASGDLLGRRLIAEAISAAGVSAVFTVAGGHFLPTYHELGRSGAPRVIPARHEQGAGYMASGYALAKGEPGVVLSGAPGPGATNLVTSVANAQADSIPLLVLTAQVDRRYVHRNILQHCDNVGLLAPFCKRSVQAASLDEVPNLIATGLQLAASGRPGPVHIALPQNLQADTASRIEPLPPAATTSAAPAASTVDELIERVERAQRPAVLAGHGVLRSGGSAALADFCERLGAPVATSRSGIGSISTAHPRSVGMLGFYGTDTAREAIGSADLVLVAGCALGEQTTFGWRPDLFADGAQLIQIDADSSQINRVYRVDQGIVGSVGAVLAATSPRVAQREPWFTRRPPRTPPQNDPARGLSAASVIAALNEASPDGTVVSADIGNHRLWVCEQLDVTRPEGLLQSCEFDAMGFSLPAAIGAAVALPQTAAVAIAGDGGFVHTMGELIVAQDLGLPLVAVVFVDGALGILRHQAEAMYGEDHFVRLGPIDFAAVARAFGVASRTVSDATDLKGAFDWALSLGGPALLAIAIDPEEVFPPLRSKIEQRKIDLMGR
ncbi:MAG: thiamine pyrophosphate-binding protein [Acidimicrobiaceae bacterium]|nr:thiamine pyrophosphate-binding protein [Acidimicrobiaceae bacterium]MYE09068.1 thiamine pyrophosphate-binding protein [Acidimicrobiaceae bacterium]MYI34935.1 thiamine pyrophosphate-binding protein [Acidimicrobiaceae bacterium]